MAREIISAVLTSDYNPDRGGNVPNLSFRFGKPTDFSDANVTTLLGLLNARVKTAADRSACPVASEFKPRKLRFVRTDGNSLSFALFNKGSAVSIATQIRDAINGINPDNQVQCIELIGEEWIDLLPELRTATGAPVPGLASRSALGGKQYAHSGKILYQYDGGNGTTQTAAVRVDTDVVTNDGITSPPSILGGAWAGCVGDFELQNPCANKEYLDHRRYVATLLNSEDPTEPTAPTNYQTTEVPVKNEAPADILACGQSVADLASIVCLAYRGETNKRLHLFL